MIGCHGQPWVRALGGTQGLRLPGGWSGAYLWMLSLALLGYAILGKGFAYFGVGPVYVSELLLSAGVVAVIVVPSARRRLITYPVWLVPLQMMMLWGAICTVPYLREYGIDALRDAVLWGYGLFAVVVFALLNARPGWLTVLVDRYERFAWLFPMVIFLVLMTGLLRISVPSLPDSHVSVISPKLADIGVHLAGVSIVFLLGMLRRNSLGWLVLVWASFAIAASQNRGGALAFAVSTAFVVVVGRSLSRRLIRLAVVGICLAVIGMVAMPSITLFQGRQLSVQQIVVNYLSVVTDSTSSQGLVLATKGWRLAWWSRIIEYTVGGEHFWTGKGFGVNLADDDGFQVNADGSLRSPHNSHLTMLARSGVPGFTLWVATQLVWIWLVLRSRRLADRRGHTLWSRLFLFLAGYWVAFVTAASFDVFLEGPMAGVWFWVLYGAGLAAVRIYRTSPQTLISKPGRSAASRIGS